MSQTEAQKNSPTFTGKVAEWPQWGATEERHLLEAFRSGNWWYGDRVAEFEREYAAAHDARHGITCSNGTIALEVALRALGIGPGDEVIVPDYTFIATAGACVTVGAIPRFADVDPISANIDLASAEKLVTPFTRAMIVVHFAGLPVDLDAARVFAQKHNIKLIEDAAHSWGSQWKGKGVGAWGDAGTFSFQVSKNLASGEGGIILTDNDDLAEILRAYTNCGRLKDGAWYEHFIAAGNNRLTELQAAILLGQLERLEEHTAIREENARFLDAEFSRIPGLRVPVRDERVTRRSYHLYVLNYEASEFGGLGKKDFIAALEKEGVPATGGYLFPVHANYCYMNLNDKPRPENRWLAGLCNERGIRFDAIDNPNARKLADESMVWLFHTLLLGTRTDMEQVVEAVAKVQSQHR